MKSEITKSRLLWPRIDTASCSLPVTHSYFPWPAWLISQEPLRVYLPTPELVTGKVSRKQHPSPEHSTSSTSQIHTANHKGAINTNPCMPSGMTGIRELLQQWSKGHFKIYLCRGCWVFFFAWKIHNLSMLLLMPRCHGSFLLLSGLLSSLSRWFIKHWTSEWPPQLLFPIHI